MQYRTLGRTGIKVSPYAAASNARWTLVTGTGTGTG
jgi:hypothetical protein